jgi:hypothetical protein
LPKLSSGKTGCFVLLVMAGVFATALGASFLSGQDAVNGCLWAILVSAVAGIGGFIPFILAGLSRKPASIEAVIGASAIRLLLVLAGLVIIIFFTKVNLMWFALWMGLFYIVILVAEVYIAIRIVNEHGPPVGEVSTPAKPAVDKTGASKA